MSADAVLPLLEQWMPQQRWYAAKGRTPQLHLVDATEHPSGQVGVRVHRLLVADGDVLYQVPAVVRGAADAHVIGTLSDSQVVVDGPFDPAYTRVLAAEVMGAARTDARVLAGEQSNTSIIYPESPPAIVKVFRQVTPGVNPDIELQSALAAHGCTFVPGVSGHLDGSWTDGDTRMTGSLAFAQEFLPGVEDAWRVAQAAARTGESFAERAQELGHAVSAVHAALAELFGATDVGDATRDALLESWEHRLDLTTAEVPAVRERADRIRAVYRDAADAAWPPLQRIHGDLHLGQVLRAPKRGWVLLDFEGEPLRPIAERRQPDSAIRDVAGVLRSFDYVAGSLAQQELRDAHAWATEARSAFLDGYGPVPATVLAAFEVDKAVYEARYEVRNRPDWLAIPLAAIQRLTT